MLGSHAADGRSSSSVLILAPLEGLRGRRCGISKQLKFDDSETRVSHGASTRRGLLRMADVDVAVIGGGLEALDWITPGQQGR
jgi:hypothetical protein